MAYAATLLFVNNWNIEKATEMHNLIENLPNTDNSLGNVIGLNPFINYEAWITLKFSLIWKMILLNTILMKNLTKKK